MSKKEKQLLKNLIERHLQGLTSKEEDELLINYFESFQGSREWNELLGDKKEVFNQMQSNIQQKINKESTVSASTKVVAISRRKKKVKWYYYAAASVVLFSTILYTYNTLNEKRLKDNKLLASEQKTLEKKPTKVLLTLEDGSVVELGNGNKYSSKNVKSHGDTLVYEKNNTATKNTSEAIKYNEVTIPRGGQFALTLSDSTRVWLNSDSKIKYPVVFPKGSPRVVELVYGEAYFDVTPSKNNEGTSFQVKNKNQKITVLGTEFNVKAYNDESVIKTTLVEGKVAVKTASKEELLTPNQQLTLNKSNLSTKIATIKVYDAVAWRDGVFSFNNHTLEEIMTVLARWYDVEIIFKNNELRKTKFTGVLRREKSISEILSIIKESNTLNYDIKNRTLYIK